MKTHDYLNYGFKFANYKPAVGRPKATDRFTFVPFRFIFIYVPLSRPTSPLKEEVGRDSGTGENELPKVVFVQQVGTALACAFQRLLESPVVYQFVIAREQYVGHFPTLVIGGTCVNGRGHQALLERIRQCGTFVVQHSGKKSHNTVCNHGGCQFASAQYVIAYGNLSCDKVFSYSFIDTLVMSAEYAEVLFQSQLVANAL